MSENKQFADLQRLNSAVMAKYQWTSSLIGMQRTSDETHNRRTQTRRKANEFLQELLQKRSDGSLMDDNGALDRYHKFLKYRTNLDNDDDLLNEFDRRLRALNNHRRDPQAKIRPSHGSQSIITDSPKTIATKTGGEAFTPTLNIAERVTLSHLERTMVIILYLFLVEISDHCYTRELQRSIIDKPVVLVQSHSDPTYP